MNPEPLPVELLISEDKRREKFPNSPRAKELRHLETKLGADGLQWFLKTPQPDLGDMTGAELLQSDPAGLLARLKRLEVEKSLAEIDSELDEMTVVDPYGGDPPSKRKDRETSRLLAILDSLDTERGFDQ